MTKLILIFFIIYLTGCYSYKTPATKPFIITSKVRYDVKDSTYYRFEYMDSNGVYYDFYDRNKYNIGDTIK